MILAGRNFGSGSSREAAVYALVDAGIRAVIAPRFGDIFASNAVNNGLLPARVDKEGHALLKTALAQGPRDIAIDIDNRCIELAGAKVDFALDDSWATKLSMAGTISTLRAITGLPSPRSGALAIKPQPGHGPQIRIETSRMTRQPRPENGLPHGAETPQQRRTTR